MAILLSSQEAKALDALAADRFGIGVEALMEHAGRSVAKLAEPMCRSGRAVIFVGPGNNGGDGLVAARYLAAAGFKVEVALAVPAGQLRGAAKVNLERWNEVAPGSTTVGALALADGDLAIDALLGTGLNRPPEGSLRDAIRHLNAARGAGAMVVSVDVPSGLNADTGAAPGDCVRADVTVTLAARKRGLTQEPGSTLAGRVEIGSIGLPAEALGMLGSRASLFELGDLRPLLPPREGGAFKNSFGHVLLVAGSPGKTGAGTLAVRAALRSGAGLVTLAGREQALAEILAGHPEAMSHALAGQGPLGPADLAGLLSALEGKQALAIGPGLWRGPETGSMLKDLLARFKGPTVLDADALNAIAAHPGTLAGAAGPTVVTPHPGEMARLTGRSGAEVQAARFAAAAKLAGDERTVVVLKGAGTVVAAPDGRLSVNPTGNAGLAHGGTGDVLCGLIGGLLAQGMEPFDAARAGAYLHGWAGERVSKRRGQRGLLAGEVADELGSLWAELGC
jgi:NAD(P)H-hydrate epimerase